MDKTNDLIKTVLAIILTTAINHLIAPFVGYQAIGFVFMMALLTLSLFVGFYYTMIFAVSSALIWNFFFIPPYWTFAIAKTEDAIMNLAYIFTAVIAGYMTSRIKNNERLLALKEARESLYQTIMDSVSHELKTPVTSIVGIASALSAIKDEDKRMELIGDLADSADRMDRIVTNLLDMSRLSSGELSLKKDWQDIEELVNVCVNQFKNKLSKYKIAANIENGLPLIMVDFILIEQALSNILLNAALYSPEGSEIQIIAEKEFNLSTGQMDMIVIKIKDRGPGIKEHELLKIFNKFYRAEGSRPGGTGLGLAIAKGVIGLHNGTIKAHNRKNGGLEVAITLPIERQPELKEIKNG